MNRTVLIIIAAVLVACAMLQIRSERNRRAYWRSVEQRIDGQAAYALAAQDIALAQLERASNMMTQVLATRKTAPLMFGSVKIPDGPILETNRYAKFYDDRTNLVLTVIHTNGTWEVVKP